MNEQTIKSLRQIATDNGLQLITTTISSNGYPSNLADAIIGFDSFEQAKQLAELHNLSIEIFTKKDGWQLYCRTNNTMYEPLTNSADDYGDDYSEFNPTSELHYISECSQFIGENIFQSFDDLQDYIATSKKLYELFENKNEDEIIITCQGNYYDTIKRNSMSFYHDTKTTVIGLIDRG